MLNHTVTNRDNPAPPGCDGNMRSMTPVCICGWEGFAVHPYNDDMFSSLNGQARSHVREAEAVERCDLDRARLWLENGIDV